MYVWINHENNLKLILQAYSKRHKWLYEQKDINFLVIVAKNANENGPGSWVAKDPRILYIKMLKFYFSHSSQKYTHNKDCGLFQPPTTIVKALQALDTYNLVLKLTSVGIWLPVIISSISNLFSPFCRTNETFKPTLSKSTLLTGPSPPPFTLKFHLWPNLVTHHGCARHPITLIHVFLKKNFCLCLFFAPKSY